MNKLLKILFFLSIFSAANAQQDIYKLSLDYSAGLKFADIENSEFTKYQHNIGVNYNFSKSFALGIQYVNYDFNTDFSQDSYYLKLTYFTDNDYLIFSRAKFAPYLAAAIAYRNSSVFYKFDLGLKYRFADKMNIFTEFNYIDHNYSNFNLSNTTIQVGLRYNFVYTHEKFNAPTTLIDNDFNTQSELSKLDTFLLKYNSQINYNDSLVILDTIFVLDSLTYNNYAINSGSIYYTDSIYNSDRIIYENNIEHNGKIINRKWLKYQDSVQVEDINMQDSTPIVRYMNYADSVFYSDTIPYTDNINYTDTAYYNDTIVYSDTVDYIDTIYYTQNLIYHDTLVYVKSALSKESLLNKGYLFSLNSLIKEKKQNNEIYYQQSEFYSNTESISNQKSESTQDKSIRKLHFYKENGSTKVYLEQGDDIELSFSKDFFEESKVKSASKSNDSTSTSLDFGSNENANSRLNAKFDKLEEQNQNQIAENENIKENIESRNNELNSLKEQIQQQDEMIRKQQSQINALLNSSLVSEELDLVEEEEKKSESDKIFVFDSNSKKRALLDDKVNKERQTVMDSSSYQAKQLIPSENDSLETENDSLRALAYKLKNDSLLYKSDSLTAEIENLNQRLNKIEYLIQNLNLQQRNTRESDGMIDSLKYLREINKLQSQLANQRSDTILKIKTEKETIFQERDVEVEKDLRFVRFYYETNVFKLDSDQIKRLNNLINVYKQNDDFKIMISGFADGSGNSEYNRKLTDRRIGEIISYMISQGVDKDRIYSISYGDQKSSESENPQDRRVEVRIFDFY